MNSSKNIAIIPARGGSKRIPRKNIKDFLGKPIIAYSIEAAIKSELFDEVMVSTDDDEIAEIAKKYGAKIPFRRSNKNSNDFANTTNVLLEVLEKYQKAGREYNYFCCLYPTSPLVTSKILKDSFSLMINKKADGLFPVVKFSYPVQRAFRINSKGKLEYIWPENINKRSQDLEPVFHDAGQFYWMKRKIFIKEKKMLYDNIIPYILSALQVQDIDNEEDWDIAKIKFSVFDERK